MNNLTILNKKTTPSAPPPLDPPIPDPPPNDSGNNNINKGSSSLAIVGLVLVAVFLIFKK